MYLFAECVSVNTERVDVPKRGRNPALPKKLHQRVYPLRIVYMEIPKHARIWNVCLWVTLMASIHARELDRISYEEDGQVIEDKVFGCHLQ